MRSARVLTLAWLAALSLLTPAPAGALPAPAGVQRGRPVDLAAQSKAAQNAPPCNTGIPIVGVVISELCEGGEEVVGAVGEVVGGVAKAAGEGVMDLVSEWMIGAATAITSFVAQQMRETTTPELQSSWFLAQFRPMADLGAALGLLVALIALASAAIRRSPAALAATLEGIVRAGLGTVLAVAFTVIALDVSDAVSGAVLGSSSQTFFQRVAHAWGTHSFGGFGSSALATLIALVEVIAALFVWLELIARDAGIYLAVLFLPVILAASIWPALSSWIGRLGRLLLLLIVFKPVALIVLSFAGSAAAAGLSFSEGLSGSVGTILAATVIFALAAFAPWALMYLLAADSESAHAGMALRSASEAAVAGSSGRSLRNLGGLRSGGQGSQGDTAAAGDGGGDADSNGAGRFPGPGPEAPGPNGNGHGGGAGPSGGGGPEGGGAELADREGASGGGGMGADEGALIVAGAGVGGGGVGAAAGAAAARNRASSSGQGSGASASTAQPAQSESHSPLEGATPIRSDLKPEPNSTSSDGLGQEAVAGSPPSASADGIGAGEQPPPAQDATARGPGSQPTSGSQSGRPSQELRGSGAAGEPGSPAGDVTQPPSLAGAQRQANTPLAPAASGGGEAAHPVTTPLAAPNGNGRISPRAAPGRTPMRLAAVNGQLTERSLDEPLGQEADGDAEGE